MRRTGPFHQSPRLALVLTAVALAGCASVSRRSAPGGALCRRSADDATRSRRREPLRRRTTLREPRLRQGGPGAGSGAPEGGGAVERMESLPTAIWLSWIADTKDVPRYLDDALQQQKAAGQPGRSTVRRLRSSGARLRCRVIGRRAQRRRSRRGQLPARLHRRHRGGLPRASRAADRGGPRA